MLLHLDAADNQGRQYQLTFEPLSLGDALWEGWLQPPPPPGAAPRWLDVTSAAARAPVRVNFDASALQAGWRVEPVTARSNCELLVEAAAADLLAAALMPVPRRGAAAAVTAEAAGIGSVVAVLLALGLLPPAARPCDAWPPSASGSAPVSPSRPPAWPSRLRASRNRGKPC